MRARHRPATRLEVLKTGPSWCWRAAAGVLHHDDDGDGGDGDEPPLAAPGGQQRWLAVVWWWLIVRIASEETKPKPAKPKDLDVVKPTLTHTRAHAEREGCSGMHTGGCSSDIIA